MSNWIPDEYDQHDPYDVDEVHGDKGQTGDICPWCGDPIQVIEDLVTAGGEPIPNDIGKWPTRVFHEDCWKAELSAKRADENVSLEDFTDDA
ncbi:hypothetical protein M197_gp72 [Haloarcula hispanica tailed virus 2]|uniref:Uncharacterized protein n=1 Tax=Haloarcula hispanica tailed virus 2 TaxID=1273751 RepID=R4TG79_9CAUD|nr:hypothetical protein M197_gp72 [Haloarcula hispanica tailed virus 2]AGM11236.1 hypothetical protein HHTV2_72 [Haloarcula hispanica tailed virus 2]